MKVQATATFIENAPRLPQLSTPSRDVDPQDRVTIGSRPDSKAVLGGLVLASLAGGAINGLVCSQFPGGHTSLVLGTGVNTIYSSAVGSLGAKALGANRKEAVAAGCLSGSFGLLTGVGKSALTSLACQSFGCGLPVALGVGAAVGLTIDVLGILAVGGGLRS